MTIQNVLSGLLVSQGYIQGIFQFRNKKHHWLHRKGNYWEIGVSLNKALPWFGKMRIISETHPNFCNRGWQSAWTLQSFMKKQHGINCKNKSTDKMQMHFFVLNYYLMEVDGGPHASLYVYSIWYPIVLNVILNINLRWFRIHKTNLKCNFFTSNHILTTPKWQFSLLKPLLKKNIWLHEKN